MKGSIMNVSLGGRTVRWLAGAATAFLMLPMALAAPASADVAVDRTPDKQVEQSQGAPENNPEFWVGENGSTQCWKHEGGNPIDGGSHGEVLADDKSVWQMGTPPTGVVFSLLVLKSGTMNDVFYDPTPGGLYGTVSGQDVSHVIVCKKPAPIVVVAAPPAFTDPTCDNDNTAAVVTTPVTGVRFTTVGTVAPGETVTVTATAEAGYVLAPGQNEWEHTFTEAEDCTEPTEVAPQVTFTDPTCDNDNTASWAGEEIDGVTYEVTEGEVGPGQTVTVTATLAEGLVLAEGAQTTFEHTFADAEECIAPPPPAIEVAFKDAVCRLDVPYLKYDINVTGTPNTTATITFLNPNSGGADVVFADQPLEGELLWPGAAAGPDGKGTDWPGWRFEGGKWIQGDEFDWVRPTVEVKFQVNPEVTATVSYPPASAACANPPQTEVLDTTVTPPPATSPATLPATGAGGTPALLGYALLLLTVGAALVALPGRLAKAAE